MAEKDDPRTRARCSSAANPSVSTLLEFHGVRQPWNVRTDLGTVQGHHSGITDDDYSLMRLLWLCREKLCI